MKKTMYKTPELIKKINLKEIQIPNQDKIEAETGAPLDLQQAFEIIREVSQDFKLMDEKALEADDLLSKLITRELQRSKKSHPSEEKQEKNAVGKAQESQPEKASVSRKRKLILIKMKMQLEKEKKSKTKK